MLLESRQYQAPLQRYCRYASSASAHLIACAESIESILHLRAVLYPSEAAVAFPKRTGSELKQSRE